MIQPHDKIFNALKRLRLSDAERTRIRVGLVSYVRAHPANAAPAASPAATRASVGALRPRRLAWAFGLAAVVIAATAGTAYAAHFALPGDRLYPFKVHVNEEVQTFLAFEPEAKAQVIAGRAETRLAEAEDLAAADKLSAADRGSVELEFDREAKQVADFVQQFHDRGEFDIAARVSSDFEAKLRAHGQIMETLKDNSSDPEILAPLVSNVTTNINMQSDERTTAEGKLSHGSPDTVRAAADDAQKKAQHAIDDATAAVNAASGALGNQAALAQAELQQAAAIKAQADASVAASSWGEAFSLYQQAKRVADQVRLLVVARSDWKIDVNVQAQPGAALTPLPGSRSELDGSDKGGDNSTSPADGSVHGLIQLRGHDGHGGY